RDLARAIIAIAAANGVATEAVLTSMGTPIGRTVGNAVEVREAIATLDGRGPADTTELSVVLTARMLVLGRIAATIDEAEARVRDALESGRGLEKFGEIIEAQGGDRRVIDDSSRLPAAPSQRPVEAPSGGWVTIDARAVGDAAVVLGAGRDRAEADVDPSAGIEILATEGSEVSA